MTDTITVLRDDIEAVVTKHRDRVIGETIAALLMDAANREVLKLNRERLERYTDSMVSAK